MRKNPGQWRDITAMLSPSLFADSVLFSGSEKARRAKLLIGLFYFFVFVISTQSFSVFYQAPDWSTLLQSRRLFVPLWSSRWMLYVDWETGVRTVLLFFFVCSFLSVFLWNRSRWMRVATFLGIFQYLSLISSFGKIDHYLHVTVVASFILVFLPNDLDNDSRNRDVLGILFIIQSFILLIYFTSGIFKFYGIVDQELHGVRSALWPDALAQQVARAAFGNEFSFFGSWILTRHSSLYSALLVIGYFIEVFSLFIIVNPHLHRLWGLMLILFHGVVLMTLGPDFTVHMIVVGIFLLFSPFGNSKDRLWIRSQQPYE